MSSGPFLLGRLKELQIACLLPWLPKKSLYINKCIKHYPMKLFFVGIKDKGIEVMTGQERSGSRFMIAACPVVSEPCLRHQN